MCDSNLNSYYFIKQNYPLSSSLLFQQHMYNNRHEIKNYLQNFIRETADEPLKSLALYYQGRREAYP